jgi:predicted DsbA family dithiol-disulfide isomerase
MTSDTKGETDNPIRIDIISDVVCPWCIIGYKQLERAQADVDFPAVVYWHPFELNPDMPDEGQDLFEHITAKYGTSKDDSRKARAKLAALASELGFLIDYTDDMRMQNTFRAHQTLHWAASKGRQHHMKMALFKAYFSDHKDVNDPDVLAETAAGVGLDRDEAAAVLDDGRHADKVRQHASFWTSRGVQGVPTMVFDGRLALVGAQGVEAYRNMLQKVSEEKMLA